MRVVVGRTYRDTRNAYIDNDIPKAELSRRRHILLPHGIQAP